MHKKSNSALGRSLMKKKPAPYRQFTGNHSTDLQDGYDWGCLQSVTEQQQLDEFLLMAEATATEYAAEKNNIVFVQPEKIHKTLSPEEKEHIAGLHKEYEKFLSIPRRPHWDKNTSAEQLREDELSNFVEWRRQLARVEEVEGIVMTPFEKNLEFWRQLWRVLERSDVVVQTVDARNPLLFRCEDLEVYVKEMDEKKTNVILVNKADLLNEEQRKAWANFFEIIGLLAAFFSAMNEQPDQKEIQSDSPTLERQKHSYDVLNCSELLDFLRNSCSSESKSKDLLTIGLVGYPNVGKSSTINALLHSKKVSVSATPGKTKHFQTMLLDDNLCLCDCPGLVMPSFVATKADLIINGILSIDRVTDCITPVTLITSRIPRHVLEHTYGVRLPPLKEDQTTDDPPTAEEFLNSYGYTRGFMTQRGLPDVSRAARYILKDYVQGKLLYCVAPPNVDQKEFQTFPPNLKTDEAPVFTPQELKINKMYITSKELDANFFKEVTVHAHKKGIQLAGGSTKRVQDVSQTSEANAKPWKKHNNRNKREKLRRIYADLDQ